MVKLGRSGVSPDFPGSYVKEKNMKLENFIALRYFRESNKNKNISTASFIVILSIAVAIIFFISSVSIMNGYIYGLMKIALEVKTFHLDCPAYFSHEDSKGLLEYIRKNENVVYADLYREAKVLFNAKGKSSGLLYFRTMPHDVFKKDAGLDQCIKIKNGSKSLKLNEVLISQRISEKLRVEVGDAIYLTAMLSDESPMIIFKRLKVSGIFTTGYVELDEQLSYISNKTAEKIFKDKVGYNIFIKLNDFKKANDTLISLGMSGIGGLISWEESNYNELTALKFEKNIIAFIVILVVFVATLNILSTIYITVFEKKQDIGILKAVGYSPKNIVVIFLLNGIYLGFTGVILGVFLGTLIVNWLNEILNVFAFFVNLFQNAVYSIVSIFIQVEAPLKFEIFSKDFYLDKIYTEISFPEIMLISSLALLFSILASIVPAIRAGNIKPIEVIKNG